MHRSLPAALLILLLCTATACAAGKHLKQARSAQVRGDAISAQHHFQQALRHRDKLADDANFRAALRTATRDAEATRGRAAAQHAQWRTAAHHFDRALEQDPSFALAADARQHAGQQAAPALFASALQRADYDDLPAAKLMLQDALQLDPQHAGAQQALQSLTQTKTPHTDAKEQLPGRDEAPDISQKTPEKLLKKLSGVGVGDHDWPAVTAAWQAAIAADPHDLPARAALHRTRGNAADDFLRRARQALAQNNPDLADEHLSAALTYRPGDPRIRPASAQANVLRGNAFLQQHRPGIALLAFRRAAQQNPRNPAAETGAHNAQNRLLEKHAARVTFTTNSNTNNPHPAALLELQSLLQHQLPTTSQGTLRLSLPDQSDQADATLSLAINSLTITRPPHTTTHRQHPYTLETSVPNPHLPRLRDRQHHDARRADQLDCDERDLCNRLLHAKRLPSPRSTSDLHHIASIERRLHRVRRDLRRARRDLRDADRKLARAPAFIIERQRAHWPYTLETHTQVGQLQGHWSLDNNPPHPIRARVHETDDTLPDPNPRIGLHQDPLQLAAPSVVRRNLLHRAATQAAASLTAQLTAQHADQLTTQARALEARQQHDAALELRVAAALLRTPAPGSVAPGSTPAQTDADLQGLALIALPKTPSPQD